jgi:hypothetical protein
VCWHNFDLEELARQKVPNGVTYHTFLAFGFFHNVFGFVHSFQDYVPQALGMYMFTEWPKHLARGLDSGESDDHIKKWLETPVDLIIGKWLRDGIEITQDTFKVLERNLCLAFQATKTKVCRVYTLLFSKDHPHIALLRSFQNSCSGDMFTELQIPLISTW